MSVVKDRAGRAGYRAGVIVSGFYHRYNAVLKRVAGNKSRARMTLVELEVARSCRRRGRCGARRPDRASASLSNGVAVAGACRTYLPPLRFWSMADATTQIGSLLRTMPDGELLEVFVPEATETSPEEFWRVVRHLTLWWCDRGFISRQPWVVRHGLVHLVLDSMELQLFAQGAWNAGTRSRVPAVAQAASRRRCHR